MGKGRNSIIISILLFSVTVTTALAIQSSFSEDFESGLGAWSAGVFQIDHTPPAGVDESSGFALPGSFTSDSGTTIEVSLDNVVFSEGATSLKTSISAVPNDRVSLGFVRDSDLFFNPVELGTLSFDVLVESGGANSDNYRWEMELQIRRADQSDPRSIHYEIGAPSGILVPAGFLPPRSFDVFLFTSPTEDDFCFRRKGERGLD